MNKPMLVQCQGCSYTEALELEGCFDDREAELNRLLDLGWRCVPNWVGYACPKCLSGKSGDPFAFLLYGRPKPADKLVSYVELRTDAEALISDLETLDLLSARKGGGDDGKT